MDSRAMEVTLESWSSQAYHKGIFEALKDSDEQVYKLITAEYERLSSTIQLLAAENRCSRQVLAALGSVVQNKTSEGFAGARMHGGSGVVDEIERLAVSRAKSVFGAGYANVQPHSGTTANQIVINALLEPGEKILSMAVGSGGHYSHGSEDSLTRRFYNIRHYYVDRDSLLLDYDRIAEQAETFGPMLIICGASAYSRALDFERFRRIADDVGAYLLADISHLSALVIAGAHASPIDCADVTTTSTYKPGGPRGGLVLMGKDFDRSVTAHGRTMPLWRHIEKVTFPGLQGTPYLNNIAAKAVFLKEALSEEYKARQFRVIENARRLAENLINAGYDVPTGGTDNHIVLVNVSSIGPGLSGAGAQRCLEQCGIVVDKCPLPYDKRSAGETSGIRLGTPIVTRNGMGVDEIDEISAMVDEVLRKAEPKGRSECTIGAIPAERIRAQVKELCGRFGLR